MKTGSKVIYTGEDNEVTMLKKGDAGIILLSHGDGYFEVEFLDEEGIVKVLETLNEEFLESVPEKV
jgi:hypothetical protein